MNTFPRAMSGCEFSKPIVVPIKPRNFGGFRRALATLDAAEQVPDKHTLHKQLHRAASFASSLNAADNRTPAQEAQHQINMLQRRCPEFSQGDLERQAQFFGTPELSFRTVENTNNIGPGRFNWLGVAGQTIGRIRSFIQSLPVFVSRT